MNAAPPRQRWRLLFLQVALFLLVMAAADGIGLIQPIEGRLGDVLLRLDAAGRTPPTDILRIDIDQRSLDDPAMLEVAGNWPWPRAIHGELLDWISRQQPRAVVFDLIFSEPDVFRPESDRVLATALARTGAYLPLVVAKDGEGSLLAKLSPILQAQAGPQAVPDAALPLIAPKAFDPSLWRSGLINVLEDPDGIGRRYWLAYPHQGWTLPSLPARVARDLGLTVPAADALPLHWYREEFPHVSYDTVYLESQKQNPTGLPDLKGKIVIVGATAPGLSDMHPTPLGATTLGPDILATALGNLQAGDGLHVLSPHWNLLLAAILMVLLALAYGRRTHPLLIGSSLALVTLACLGVAFFLLRLNLQWQPFTGVLFAWLFFATQAVLSYLRERNQRDHALRLFGRFIDPRVVTALAEGQALAEAQVGRSREVSVLFSDIRGFTTLSETRSPEEIVALLNRYFDLQVEGVFAHQGTLDKFIGDAIMAFWGAPMDDPHHARNAILAALDMEQRLEQFKAELGDLGQVFDVGIGIHSGPAVVGFLGATRRLDYTVIGDTVNLASRIEGQTKGIARILISEGTRAACQAAGDEALFDFIDHGEFTVKGRAQAVRLFEPRLKQSSLSALSTLSPAKENRHA
ncbi:MAG TPA: adenylate/guanylate cyclase domain-containing protein [Rhodocyclaceae bacterium]|jgi:adenylate cyclase|nr:adenylate/guanylate cyclase domain-containing protein [Rhodocyclaceae bacterium]